MNAAAALGAVSMPQAPIPAKEQPPLHATGFIQGEHGTLIPVYQPDALNDYMNGASPTAQQTRNALANASPASSNSPTLGRLPPGVAAPYWPQGYPQPSMYGYPVPNTALSATIGPSGATNTTSLMAGVQQQPPAYQHHLHGQVLPASGQWSMPSMNSGPTLPQTYHNVQIANSATVIPRNAPLPPDRSTPHPNRFSQRRDVSVAYSRSSGDTRSPSSNGRTSARALPVSGTPGITPTRQRLGPASHQSGSSHSKQLPEGMHTHSYHHPQWNATLPHPQ